MKGYCHRFYSHHALLPEPENVICRFLPHITNRNNAGDWRVRAVVKTCREFSATARTRQSPSFIPIICAANTPANYGLSG